MFSIEYMIDTITPANSSVEYQSDIALLLEDCSGFERRVIYELVRSAKSILRDNKSLIEVGDKYS